MVGRDLVAARAYDRLPYQAFGGFLLGSFAATNISWQLKNKANFSKKSRGRGIWRAGHRPPRQRNHYISEMARYNVNK